MKIGDFHGVSVLGGSGFRMTCLAGGAYGI